MATAVVPYEQARAHMKLPVRAPAGDLLFTPIFRLCFPHLDTPGVPPDAGADAKPVYSIEAVFDASADLEIFQAAIGKALAQKMGIDKAKELFARDALRLPFRPKRQRSGTAGYEGDGVFSTIRAQPQSAPACIDKTSGKDVPIAIGQRDRVFYGGCFCYAAVTVYAYDNRGKGASLSLRTLVKIAEGEPLAGAPMVTKEEVAAATDFTVPWLQISGPTDPFTVVDGTAETVKEAAAANRAGEEQLKSTLDGWLKG